VRLTSCLIVACASGLWLVGIGATSAVISAELSVAFETVEITPAVDGPQPVWLAGYGWGRQATGVHDPLFARTVVVSDGARRFALVSVDLVGLQYPEVLRIRAAVPEVDYVVVSSTHNHEGPDTIGIWGKTPFQRGVDEAYLTQVVDSVAQSIRRAIDRLAPAQAKYGTASDESLLGDSRLPVAKDGVLRVIRFDAADSAAPPRGLLVQWNCHPEAMGSKNTEVTADFCHTTVKALEEKYRCPVAYFSGALGGLMAPPDRLLRDPQGEFYQEGDFAYAAAYGQAVANLATRAIDQAAPIQLTPLRASAARVAIPVENSLYRTARLVGVLRRQAVEWTGDFHQTPEVKRPVPGGAFAIGTEVACLQLGELYIGCVPGELYPELVYGHFQEPLEPNVDYPDADLEPTVQQLIPSGKWLLFGLANDEIGYIIPRRQWDLSPPYAYGRTRAQYGEVNSCSVQAAPIVMQALAERVAELAQ